MLSFCLLLMLADDVMQIFILMHFSFARCMLYACPISCSMVRLPRLYLQGVQMMSLVMQYYFLLFDPSILVSLLFLEHLQAVLIL